jgi:hypothetical protein
VPWNGGVSWEIAPWGYWYMAGENQTHKVIVYLFIDYATFITSQFQVLRGSLYDFGRIFHLNM